MNDTLPAEILCSILRYVGRHAPAGLVCRVWHDMISASRRQCKMRPEYMAARGYLGCLKWLRHHEGPTPYRHYCFEKAAENGHIRVLEFLGWNENWNHHYLCEALAQGQLWVVTHFHWIFASFARDKVALESFYWSAAKGGHVKIVRYLAWRFSFPVHIVCPAAALGGCRDVLKWALRGISLEHKTVEDMIYRAAQGGHVDIMGPLLQAFGDAKLQRNVFTEMISSGHGHLVRWWHEYGLIWDEEIIATIVFQCGRHTADWAMEHHHGPITQKISIGIALAEITHRLSK